MFSSLVENFMLHSASMAGRPKKSQSMLGGAVAGPEMGTGFLLFFISLAMFFIKVLLVMISYNIVIPRILDTYSVDMSRWRPLTFLEAIFLVILFNNLFSRF